MADHGSRDGQAARQGLAPRGRRRAAQGPQRNPPRRRRCEPTPSPPIPRRRPRGGPRARPRVRRLRRGRRHRVLRGPERPDRREPVLRRRRADAAAGGVLLVYGGSLVSGNRYAAGSRLKGGEKVAASNIAENARRGGFGSSSQDERQRRRPRRRVSQRGRLMERIDVEPRQGWPAIIEQQGLIYWKTELPDGSMMPYWHESNAYTLGSDEVYEMEASVRLLMEMLVEAGDYIIESNLFSQMGIPGLGVPKIKETWESEPPMLYGRFDFAYGPDGFKLLEYNADTPTALVETAVQWHWVQDVYGAGGDQWNMVHELLVQRWKELKDRGCPATACYLAAHQPGEVRRGLHDRRLPGRDRREAGHDVRADADREARRCTSTSASSTREGRADAQRLQALPVGVDGPRGVRRRGAAADGRRAGPDALDRADLEDDVVQQGHPAGALAAVPGPPEPAARVLRGRGAQPRRATSASRCSRARARTR